MGKNWPRIFYLLPIGIAFLWVYAFPNELRYGESRKLIPATSLLVLVSTPFIGHAYSLLKRRFKKTPNLWLIILQFVSLCGSIFGLTLFDEFFGYALPRNFDKDFLVSPSLDPYVLITDLPFGLRFSIDVEHQFTLIRNLWAWWAASTIIPIVIQWMIFKLKRKSDAAI